VPRGGHSSSLSPLLFLVSKDRRPLAFIESHANRSWHKLALRHRALQIRGTWVFDDPAVSLKKEPFIAGIDRMIDKVVADVPDADRGFRPSSAHRHFPVML
jgi:hypothetical protein